MRYQTLAMGRARTRSPRRCRRALAHKMRVACPSAEKTAMENNDLLLAIGMRF
jgi:hypothetical protein